MADLRSLTMQDTASLLGHRTDPAYPLYVPPALTVAALRELLSSYEDTAVVYVQTGFQELVLTDERQPVMEPDPGEDVVIRARTP